MTDALRRSALLAGTFLLLLAPSARGQAISLEAGRYSGGRDRDTYRIAFTRPLAGPLGLNFYGTALRGRGVSDGTLWGAGLDGTLLRGGQPGLYLTGGFSGGFRSGAAESYWSSWSAGVGYEVYLFSALTLRAEGLWREIQPERQTGLEIAFSLGALTGSSRAPRQPAYTVERHNTPPAAAEVRADVEKAGVPADKAGIISSVVQTATDAMGTPYQWGGAGRNGLGFDCSGLIQYAYGQHGVSLPRTSSDQARVGAPVEKRLDALVPGDILTFSNGGGRVTHVGLYVGEGKFIHSATAGVQLSALSPDDLYGRWWWSRWVGARRVID